MTSAMTLYPMRTLRHAALLAVVCALAVPKFAVSSTQSVIYFNRTPGMAYNQAFPSTFTTEMLLNVSRTIAGPQNPNLKV